MLSIALFEKKRPKIPVRLKVRQAGISRLRRLSGRFKNTIKFEKRDDKIVSTAQAMQLRAAFQYYADRGRLMTVRRADTEEITLLDENASPLATLRTDPIRYITDIWETRDIGENYVLTSLVCDHIPPIDQFEAVWDSFRGRRNIIVTEVKMHKGCVRDLSKEALLSGTLYAVCDLQSLEKKCPKILEKVAPLRPADLLPYMRAEDGWTNEMIDEMLRDLQT